MRIAAVNQDPGIGPMRAKGAAVHLQAMREAFARLGHEVVPFDEPEAARLRARMTAERSAGLDLIYERYALGADAAARFAREHDIPLVLEVNAPLAEEARRFRGVAETQAQRERDAFLFGQASQVVAVSSEVARYALERGAADERVVVMPNAIDERRFNPDVDATMVRGKLPPDRFVLGFHGRVRPWHGFGLLVAAARDLLARGIPAHLLVVGNGDFPELAALPDDAHTRFGWQRHEDMPAFVAAYDVLPLTYPADLPCYFSPLKLMEAMACGAVPVVPDLGDLPTIVRDGENGLVYPAGDLPRLTQALARLAGDEALRRSLGGAAAQTAAGCSWTRIARRVLDHVGTLNHEADRRVRA